MASFEKKIKDAETIVADYMVIKEKSPEQGSGIEKLTKAIDIYKQVCMDPRVGVDDKLAAILSMIARIPQEADEMIVRWRDMIPFVSGTYYTELVTLLVKLSKNSAVKAHERTLIAVMLYNRALLNICFKCFESIAIDKTAPAPYRIESCRYLYGTEESESKELAQECLMDILEDFSLTSDYRYKIITGFISNKGVVSYLNTSKIRVPYDEGFVYGLQMAFFQETKNGVRERILSGQHLLQMSSQIATNEEKANVGTQLMAIASDATLEENIRADAADVMLRLGTTAESQKARQMLVDIGYSAVNVRNENFLDRVKTLYNNSQNMHDEPISSSVQKFIEKIMNEDIRLIPYEDAQTEVIALVRTKKLERGKNFRALQALNRISIDTAVFSSKNVTLAEIFIHVWLRIKKYEGDTKKMLEDRLIEELIDMGDTCSTGHSGRFVNVLSKVDPDLNITISFEAQIIANVAGRVNALINKIEDPNIKSAVSMGMFPEATEEDVAIYRKFIEDALKHVFDEMHTEFVGGKYTSEEEFSQYFQLASKEWKR
jgi:hypothetical protein